MVANKFCARLTTTLLAGCSVVLLLIVSVTEIDGLPAKHGKQVRDRRPFALDDVIPSKFSFKGFNGTWISGHELMYKNTNGDLIVYAADLNSHKTFVPAEELKRWNTSTSTLSPDRKHLLIRYDVINIFRHSTTAKYSIYDIESKMWSDIADGNYLQICQWAPNGGVGFVMQNNVFFRNEAGEERQLTDDGVPGVIYNGVPDWVYEEEVFGNDDGMWFSPDGTQLAIVRFNDTEVEEFTYFLYGEPGSLEDQYPTPVHIRYPKPATPNPVVTLRIVDLTADEIVWRDIDAPEKVTDDHIIGSVAWASNTELSAMWLNRRQNLSTIQSCNTATLDCRELMELVEPNGWVDVVTPMFADNGNKCFLLANRNGWRHIISYQDSTNLVLKETSGNITVLDILGYDAEMRELYYMATTETNPGARHVYKNDECLSCRTLSNTQHDDYCTYASAKFSKDFSHYALTCSGPGPAVTHIYSASSDEPIMAWEENLAARTMLEEFEEPQIHQLFVPVDGGFNANVKLILPPEIDLNASTWQQQYAMIVFVYGGPNSVRVTEAFGIGFQNYLTTTRKVIYAQIDGRGSGNKGTDMLFTVNNNLGTVEVFDQIAVTKALIQRFRFIDGNRVGIWGWSYGGYATAMTLARDNERVFQCGISVAPVTSWIYYDSIYTERYMGLPTEMDNIVGYNEADVTRRVEEMREHQYMLIHGNADDNVHFQQAMALARALQNATIMFEQMSYPDEAHGLNGVQSHLYRTMDQFWGTCLNLTSVTVDS